MATQRCFSLAVVLLLASVAIAAEADKAAPLSALSRMPVREVTIFKDGHAVVVHAGKMPVDADGNLAMDYLPTPIMGTFWPYSADKNAKLTAVVAGQRRVLVERTSLTIPELIEANIGGAATLTEVIISGNTIQTNSYTGTILGIPTRSAEELEATSPPNTGRLLPQKSGLVLIRTEKDGTRIVSMSNIRDLAIHKQDVKLPLAQEELRNTLTLKLAWDNKPLKEAEVGMMYVQRGLRWIPSYRIQIDGKGTAQVKLEATLINELTDMEDVTANLVVGVPTFDFKETLDPIGMQATMAQLSQYFQQDSRSKYAMSNALMSQTAARMGERLDQAGAAAPGGEGPRPGDLGPELAGSQKREDMFVFTVNHVTLKKGQRMVLPVVEFALKYKDVYRLEIPITPPEEVRKSFDQNRQAEITRLMNAPKVMHSLRLTNSSKYPLTTAPALILLDNTVLAQGMSMYTGIGGQLDLPLTAAVDIQVKRADRETKRQPNAETWEGYAYNRIELAGTIMLTNLRGTPVDVEVVRYVAGVADKADMDGKAEMINAIEERGAAGASGPYEGPYYPYWWYWYGWPYWWNHFNGIGRFTWNFTLQPEKAVEVGYTWHYLWR